MLTSEACTTDKTLPRTNTQLQSTKVAAVKLGNEHWHFSARELNSDLYHSLTGTPPLLPSEGNTFYPSLASVLLNPGQHNHLLYHHQPRASHSQPHSKGHPHSFHLSWVLAACRTWGSSYPKIYRARGFPGLWLLWEFRESISPLSFSGAGFEISHRKQFWRKAQEAQTADLQDYVTNMIFK